MKAKSFPDFKKKKKIKCLAFLRLPLSLTQRKKDKVYRTGSLNPLHSPLLQARFESASKRLLSFLFVFLKKPSNGQKLQRGAVPVFATAPHQLVADIPCSPIISGGGGPHGESRRDRGGPTHTDWETPGEGFLPVPSKNSINNNSKCNHARVPSTQASRMGALSLARRATRVESSSSIFLWISLKVEGKKKKAFLYTYK